MRWILFTIAVLLTFLPSENISAQAYRTDFAICFDANGSPVETPDKNKCYSSLMWRAVGVIARDAASDRTLYEVFEEGKYRKGKLPPIGLKDGSGRVIVAPSYGVRNFQPLSANLVFGKISAYEAVIIRISDGWVRPIRYDVMLTIVNPDGPPMFMGRDLLGTRDKIFILDSNGEETGGVIAEMKWGGTMHGVPVSGFPVLRNGLLGWGNGSSPAFFAAHTQLGEPVFPGKAIFVGEVGVLAPVAPGPALPGHTRGADYFGTVAPSGSLLPMAPGVLGITRLWDQWYIVRQAKGQLSFERANRDKGAPDLAGPPINPLYHDISIARTWVLGKTARGWIEITGGQVGTRVFASAADGHAAKEAGYQAVLAEIEAARQRQIAERETARQAAIAVLRADIDAVRNKYPSVWQVEAFYARMAALGVRPGEINLAGLPSPLTPQERYCMAQPGGQCRGAIDNSGGSPSYSSWTNSMDAGLATMRRQNAENCARADKGASIICYR